MNPTEINRAIAELRGWKFVPSRDLPSMLGILRATGEHWEHEDGRVSYDDPPNYHTSLDACAAFERTIKDVVLYEHYLGEITKSESLWLRRAFVGERFKLATATAPQRCEAFLRMHGKWIDNE